MPYKDIEAKRASDRARYRRKRQDPEWVRNQRERTRLAMAKRRSEHPEVRERDRLVARQSLARRYAEDPAPFFDRARRRRALEAQAPGSHTEEEFQTLCQLYDYRCFYCGDRFTSLSRDHVTPLSRGGSDTILNIVPACQFCNASKNDATLLEFEIRRTKKRRK